MEEKKITDMRRETGLTQKEFSEKFGIPLRTLQRWEQGQNEVPAYTLGMIGRILAYEQLILQMKSQGNGGDYGKT